jgi:mono/diheme cytochrome c family protein
LLVVLGVLAALTPLAAHDPVTTNITYAREIHAILQARCASCHSPGGPAPMSLMTYDEVRPWARGIKDQVLTRRMPKWSAAHGYGAFANDPSLTPTEMATVAAWVDGGQPRGGVAGAGSPGSPGPNGSSLPDPTVSAFRRNVRPLAIPSAATEASLGIASHWIAAWDFQPGDSLITAATFTSGDGSPIGTWVAGDGVARLPPDAGLRVVSPIRVHLQRRQPTDYESRRPARPSLLWLQPRSLMPPRRVWVEQMACGTPRTGDIATLLAVRPVLVDRGSARVWLERPGAPQIVVGWFRSVESLYARTFWLARPQELTSESRVAVDAACTMELTLASR